MNDIKNVYVCLQYISCNSFIHILDKQNENTYLELQHMFVISKPKSAPLPRPAFASSALLLKTLKDCFCLKEVYVEYYSWLSLFYKHSCNFPTGVKLYHAHCVYKSLLENAGIS